MERLSARVISLGDVALGSGRSGDDDRCPLCDEKGEKGAAEIAATAAAPAAPAAPTTPATMPVGPALCVVSAGVGSGVGAFAISGVVSGICSSGKNVLLMAVLFRSPRRPRTVLTLRDVGGGACFRTVSKRI